LDSTETGLNLHSKAQCHQIRTISKARIQNKIPVGYVRSSMPKIHAALILHLDL
jgi:mRNA interferase MazF